MGCNMLGECSQNTAILIESMVFRLHYKFTSRILILCFLIVIAQDLTSTSIACVQSSKGNFPDDAVNQFCWTQGTFTLPYKHGLLHPGLVSYTEGEEIRYHSHYQLAPWILLIQAIVFYIPHYLWTEWERKKIEQYCGIVITSTKGLLGRERIMDVVKCFLKVENSNVRYMLSHFLNLIIVFENLFLINRFLGNVFVTYGVDALKLLFQEEEDQTDPVAVAFPHLTKCTIRKFGPAGSIQNHDFKCVLAINTILEKIYVGIWYWFAFLFVLTACDLIVEVLKALVSWLRSITAKYTFPTLYQGNGTRIANKEDFILIDIEKNIE